MWRFLCSKPNYQTIYRTEQFLYIAINFVQMTSFCLSLMKEKHFEIKHKQLRLSYSADKCQENIPFSGISERRLQITLKILIIGNTRDVSQQIEMNASS